MKLSRLLVKAITSASSPAECRLSQHRLLLLLQSSSLYSTTTKPSKSYSRKQPTTKSEPSISKIKDSNLPPPAKPSENDAKTHTIELAPPKKVAGTGYEWPRPGEIPWQGKVANSVNLIGYVAMPVKFEATADGKSWAGSILTQEKVPDAPLWIPILFEGNLAHIAACHLKEKDFVHVAGQLIGDPPQFTMEQGQTSIQVMVHSLSFVQETLQRKESCTSSKQEAEVTSFSSKKELVTTDNLWIDLLANPHNWLDNRLCKSDPTSSDFKHKDSGELWIDDSTPGWIASKLETLNFINKAEVENKKAEVENKKSVDDVKDAESPWRDLVDNPQLWRDNRKDKREGRRKPKFPDFTHKNSKVPLWLNGAPEWVLSELKLNIDDVDHNTSQLVDSKAKKESVATSHLWIDLIANPRNWWDNRSSKVDPTSPDFKHKDVGELWINDSTPGWIASKLETLNFNKAEVERQKSVDEVNDPERPWRDIIDNPSLWQDNRKDKREGRRKPNYPDFKQKNGSLALWLNRAPGWFLSELKLKIGDVDHNTSQEKDNNTSQTKDKISSQPKNNKDASWESLVENPNKWWDNRSDKRNPKSPDFKHKETGEGLWLSDSPAWVTPRLPPVKSKDFGKRETLLS